MKTGSHPSWHKAVWDLGSGLQLLYPQRGRFEPEKEVKRLTSLTLKIPWQMSCTHTVSQFICLISHILIYPLSLFYHRVEAVCPRVTELNPYVHVDMSYAALDDNTDLSFLRKYQVRFCSSESGFWSTCGAWGILNWQLTSPAVPPVTRNVWCM